MWSCLALVSFEESLDDLAMARGLGRVQEKMLRFLPDEAEKRRVSRMGFKEFEMYSLRFKEYLPLKEYSWYARVSSFIMQYKRNRDYFHRTNNTIFPFLVCCGSPGAPRSGQPGPRHRHGQLQSHRSHIRLQELEIVSR